MIFPVKSVGLITYDIPHRKTQEILQGLLSKGTYRLRLITIPFQPRKERDVLFSHRPAQFIGIGPRELAKKHGLEIIELSDRDCFNGLEYALIGGAGLIPEEYIRENFIINIHPGLIPLCRGLDSFKWAIYEDKPLGNTLHFIDEGIDSGSMISSVLTPVYKEDDIASLAKRHYLKEIEMMVDFERYLKNPEVMEVPEEEPTRRMPKTVEEEMLKRFEGWRERQLAN